MPKVGDVIGGKYRVESLLGAGGMGAVFAVRHCRTDKRFAVKCLLPAHGDSREIVARMAREARISGHFEHPNVVEVYDHVEESGSAPFLVMELLEGESLADHIDRVGPLTAAAACRILLPCLHAVAAGHAVGIIHRDLKPANIFLCREDGRGSGKVKVLDFGIAKLMPQAARLDPMSTTTGRIIGSPHYMALEQMRGQEVGPRADVYALGVTLYELLTGRRPFEASSYPELVLKVASGSYEPLERRAMKVPEGLSAVVARAMAREQELRFESAAAFAAALEPYMDGSTPYAAAVQSSPAPAPTKAGSHPATVPMAAAQLGEFRPADDELATEATPRPRHESRGALGRALWTAAALITLALSADLLARLFQGEQSSVAVEAPPVFETTASELAPDTELQVTSSTPAEPGPLTIEAFTTWDNAPVSPEEAAPAKVTEPPITPVKPKASPVLPPTAANAVAVKAASTKPSVELSRDDFGLVQPTARTTERPKSSLAPGAF